MRDIACKQYLRPNPIASFIRGLRRAQSPGAKAATLRPRIVERDGLAYITFGVAK